jgi:hypothetical protein
MVSFEDVEGNPLDTAYFSFQIPAPEGAAKLVLKHNETVLDILTASNNAPTVTVLQPNGGETWSGEQTIQWSANDLDGDPLHFTILYTPDDANWYPVAANVTGTSLDINTSTLPGGNAARIKVIATDGFNNGEDESDGTFSVSDNPPEVFINTPLDNATVPLGSSSQFQGDAFDLEDSSLPEESFLWELDGSPIGTGRQASAPLSYGMHEITLSVMDSQDNVGQATIQVFAGFRAYLPLMRRTP